MIARLRVNPQLAKVIQTKPDIFAYAECLIYKNMASILPTYSLVLHEAKRNTLRRGLALFINKNHHSFEVYYRRASLYTFCIHPDDDFNLIRAVSFDLV